MAVLNQFSSISENFKKVYSEIDPYILQIEGIAQEQLDMSRMSHRYYNEKLPDMSIDANANLHEGRSYGNYLSEVSKSNIKLLGYHDLYMLLETEHGVERAQTIMRSLLNGDLYFHDSTAIQVPYCWAYSTYFLLEHGMHWGQLKSLPPKRARSFIDQVKEVTIELAQQLAGAVALSDVFVCYAHFVQKTGKNLQDPVVRKEIEDDFQSLVHTLNKKLRPSHQSPFSNVSIFDRPNLEQLFGQLVFPDGSRPDIDVIWEVQTIFCDWFRRGDPSTGFPYRFPVVTLNLRIDEQRNVLDTEALEYFSFINLAKGCFNIYISSGNKIASCCRLINDLELAGCDSFGNGGVSLGSHRVVTINLPRLGKRATSCEHFLTLLDEQLDAARDALLSHRRLIAKRIKDGCIPFVDYGVIFFERMFSTFGINGSYECLQELGFSITTEQGKEVTSMILDHIRRYAQTCSRTYGHSFNVEQVPAETLAVKFAEKDRFMYGMNVPLYSNQFIPLWVDCDIVDRINLDGLFSQKLTGGGISHLNVGEQLTTVDQMKRLIKHAISAGCEHFAINYNFCVCTDNHVTVGGVATICPMCNKPIKDYYTRIIGYFTPVSSWNKGRREEIKHRVFQTSLDVEDTILPVATHTEGNKKIEREL